MPKPSYIVGIDLGTTNSIVAYTPVTVEKGSAPEIQVFRIPQLTSPNTVEERDILPSFVFIPEQYDVSRNAIGLPWNLEARVAIGEFARERGAEIPSRRCRPFPWPRSRRSSWRRCTAYRPAGPSPADGGGSPARSRHRPSRSLRCRSWLGPALLARRPRCDCGWSRR